MKLSGINLKKAGKKQDVTDSPALSDSKATKIYYPSVSGYNGDIPGCEEVEVGKNYLFVAKAVCTSKSSNQDQDKKKVINASFEFHEIDIQPFEKKKVEGMTESEMDEALEDEKKSDE